jgi:hypothetical protein
MIRMDISTIIVLIFLGLLLVGLLKNVADGYRDKRNDVIEDPYAEFTLEQEED